MRSETRSPLFFSFFFFFLLTLGKLAAYLPKLSTKLLYLTKFPSTFEIKPVADERLDFTCFFCDLHHLHNSILHCGCNHLYCTDPSVLSYHYYNLLLWLFHQFQLKLSHSPLLTSDMGGAVVGAVAPQQGGTGVERAFLCWVCLSSLCLLVIQHSSNNPKRFKVSLYISSVKNGWLIQGAPAQSQLGIGSRNPPPISRYPYGCL